MKKPPDGDRKPRDARVAVAVSGSGRTLENLLGRQSAGMSYQIAGVIASREDCRGVEIGRRNGLPVLIRKFSPSLLAAVGDDVYAWLNEIDAGWVALGGFLKPFPCRAGWERRVVNIHPALLPKFGGRGMYGHLVHEAVLAAGEETSGATLHFVNERYDEGATIAQVRVPVRAADTPDDLAARVFAGECQLYPLVLDRLVRGTLPLPGGDVLRLDHDSK